MTTTANNKQTGNSSLTYTLLTGALLAMLTLPVQSMAGQQMQLASLEKSFNSHVVFNDIAENYGDINDEEDDGHAADEGDAKSDLMSKREASLKLLVAMTEETDITDGGGYNDNQDEE